MEATMHEGPPWTSLEECIDVAEVWGPLRPGDGERLRDELAALREIEEYADRYLGAAPPRTKRADEIADHIYAALGVLDRCQRLRHETP